MRASSGSIRSAGLHIGGRPVEGAEAEHVGLVIPLCLARAKRGLARSGTPLDRNILGLS